MPKTERQRIGDLGEEIAEIYLRQKKYAILGRNLRFKHSEVDILAHDPEDDVLVFVEVKSRSRYTEDFLPEKNAGRKKWAALRRAMRSYVAQNEYEGGYRMDLVSVVEGHVTDHVREVGWR